MSEQREELKMQHVNLQLYLDIVYNKSRGVIGMPNINPISDLMNYSGVLKEVDMFHRVYLTRNGHGKYCILTYGRD